MRSRLTSLALLFAVVGSAAFQIVLLVVAGWSGIEMVGAASLNQSLAVLACAIALSDLKSLSIRTLVQGESLEHLCRIRNALLVLLGVFSAIAYLFPGGGMLASLLLLKASAQAADINVSVWQKEKRADLIILFASLRYGGVGGILAVLALISGSFLQGLVVASAFSVLLLFIEQNKASGKNSQNGMSWQIASLEHFKNLKLVGAYASLSLAAGLNFIPQTILRYFVSLFGSMKTLGSFSIQYQVAMLCIPLITAMSQNALARRETKWRQIVSDLVKIGVASSFLLLGVMVLFISPASIILKMVFTSWVPLPALSSVMIVISSGFLCLTVYLGFISVALGKPFAQSVANVFYLASLLAFAGLFGFIYGVSGVIFGFAIATLIRLILLFAIVRSAS